MQVVCVDAAYIEVVVGICYRPWGYTVLLLFLVVVVLTCVGVHGNGWMMLWFDC